MTIDTSIGLDDPRTTKQSGIDDEARARKAREDGDSEAQGDQPARDVTREDIEAGNDRGASADQGNRSGRTNKSDDDSLPLGKP